MAADAAGGADLFGVRAVVITRAEHLRADDIRHDLDDLLRAGLRADAAADARRVVDTGDAVLHGDCPLWAGLDAVTEAHAAEDAAAIAAVEQLCRRAGGDAPIISLDACSFARSRALHNGDLFHNVLSRHAEKRCNLRRNCVCAGNAEICLRTRLQQRLCIAVAAGVAACAAVCAGQAFTNFGKARILLDRHDARRHGETHCADKADHSHGQDRDQNFHHSRALLSRTAGR